MPGNVFLSRVNERCCLPTSGLCGPGVGRPWALWGRARWAPDAGHLIFFCEWAILPGAGVHVPLAYLGLNHYAGAVRSKPARVCRGRRGAAGLRCPAQLMRMLRLF